MELPFYKGVVPFYFQAVFYDNKFPSSGAIGLSMENSDKAGCPFLR